MLVAFGMLKHNHEDILQNRPQSRIRGQIRADLEVDLGEKIQMLATAHLHREEWRYSLTYVFVLLELSHCQLVQLEVMLEDWYVGLQSFQHRNQMSEFAFCQIAHQIW